MRKLTLLVLVVILALSVGISAAQDDLSSVDPSGQTVLYWHQFRTDSAQDVAITKMVEDFNANNEYGITVEAVYIGSYDPIQEQMEAAIQSGELPNLVAGYANAAASWAMDGFVVDLMPYYDDATWGYSDEDKADLNENIIAVNTLNYGDFENTLIAWPNQISGQLLVLNMDLLAEAGYDAAPTTMAEFKDMACAVAGTETADGTPRQGYAFTAGSSEVEAFIAANGGNIFDYEADAYTFTTPEVVEILQLYQDMYNEGCAYFSDQAYGWQADFNAGLNLGFMNSTAGFTYVIDGFADTGYEANWIATPLPSGDNPVSVQLYVPSVAVVTSTPEQQLASWIFLKYMTETDNQIAWSTGTGYYPLRKSASGDALAKENFVRPDIYDYYMVGLEALNSAEINVYSSPPFASYSSVRDLVAAAFADVTVNGKNVEEVAAQLEADANEAHEDM